MKWILPGVLLLLPLAEPSLANDCQRFERQAEQLATKRRQGGSAKQMDNWKKQQDVVADRLRDCQQRQPQMQAARNTPQKGPRPAREKPLQTRRTEPHIQQLFLTCNRWIERYNQHPSADNRAFKDSACRQARAAEQSPTAPTAAPSTPAAAATAEATGAARQRPLADCIKPNNMIDKDVKHCMAGTLEPSWRPSAITVTETP